MSIYRAGPIYEAIKHKKAAFSGFFESGAYREAKVLER